MGSVEKLKEAQQILRRKEKRRKGSAQSFISASGNQYYKNGTQFSDNLIANGTAPGRLEVRQALLIEVAMQPPYTFVAGVSALRLTIEAT